MVATHFNILMDYLSGHQDTSFSAIEIANATGLKPKQVTCSLYHAKTHMSSLVQPSRGKWLLSSGKPVKYEKSKLHQLYDLLDQGPASRTSLMNKLDVTKDELSRLMYRLPKEMEYPIRFTTYYSLDRTKK